MASLEQNTAVTLVDRTRSVKRYSYNSDECRRDLTNHEAATRLVGLLPGNKDDPLRCILQCVKLADKPLYTALSYAWEGVEQGKKEEVPNSAEKISIVVNDDFKLDITSALELALLAMRDETAIRTFWIDQLCIDQADINEKGLQVAQMGTIYGEAEHVLLWAGPESWSIKTCLKTIDFLAQLWQEYGSLSSEHAEVENQFVLQYPSTPEDYISTPGLVEFLWRRVFTRGWIVQEVALAKAITVKCGQAERDWSVVAAAIHCLAAIDRRTGNRPLTLGNSDVTAPVLSMLELRGEIQATGPVSLLTGLETLQKFQTTDPRDKVFAALGMCRSDATITEILFIDYSLSVAEIYMRATKAVIFAEKSLGTFSHAGISSKGKQDLPSWTPDWSAPEMQPRSMKVARERGFCAGHKLPELSSWPASQLPVGSCPMVALAVNATRIKEIRGRAAPKGEVGSYTATFKSWRQMVQADRVDGGDASRCSAGFLRALIYPFERTWRSQPPSEDDFTIHRMPGLEDIDLNPPAHDYELDVVQIGLQHVFDLDDESYFTDFKPVGPPGRDKLVFWTFAGGYVHQPITLDNGDQIVTLEEASNGAYVYGSDLGIMTKTLQKAFDNHVFFVTENGHFGLGPIGLREGDEIYILGGCDVPLVFRREQREIGSDITTTKHRFVSECYVHEIMYGEVFDMPGWKTELITIQ